MIISLKALRVNNDWKVEDVADMLGVCPATVRYWESGRHLRLGVIRQLAEFYGVDPADIREAGLKGEVDDSKRVCETVED